MTLKPLQMPMMTMLAIMAMLMLVIVVKMQAFAIKVMTCVPGHCVARESIE